MARQAKLAGEPIKLTEGGGFKTLVPDIARHVETARHGAGFSPGEILLLQEWTYRLTDNGELKYEKAKLSLADNLQFAFRMYARAAGVEYSVPKGDAGWDKFKRAIKVRDRITHPKRARDLAVTHEELVMVTEVYVLDFRLPSRSAKAFQRKA